MMPDMHQVGHAPAAELPPPSPAVPVLMLEHVSKWYGNISGLNDVTLAISGGVTGLLGLNGAGKSTALKLIVGRIKPSSGRVRLFGVDPWSDPAPYSRVGYCPEHEQMYDWMTAFNFVSTLARLYGHTRPAARARAERVLKFVGLSDVMHKRIGQFSKGMRQRTKIAHALVNDPELIILDEPLQGTDPLARTTIMNVVRELGAMGKTIIVTSHILSEIERITEQIVLLHHGRLLALGNLHALRELLDRHPHRIAIETAEARALAAAFIGHPLVTGVRFESETRLVLETYDLGGVHRDLPGICVASGVRVNAIENPDDNLEQLLAYLTEGQR